MLHPAPIRVQQFNCICCLYPLLIHPPLLTVEGRWTPAGFREGRAKLDMQAR